MELVFAALLVRIGLEFGADLALLGAVGKRRARSPSAPSQCRQGLLVDRLGPRAVMTAAMAGASVFAVVVALAPNLALLAVALALLGAGIGLYHPAGTAMVATVSTRRGSRACDARDRGHPSGSRSPRLLRSGSRSPSTGARPTSCSRSRRPLASQSSSGASLPTARRRRLAVAERAEALRDAPPAEQRTTPPLHRTWFSRPLVIIYLSAIATGFVYRGSLTFLAVHLERELGLSLLRVGCRGDRRGDPRRSRCWQG